MDKKVLNISLSDSEQITLKKAHEQVVYFQQSITYWESCKNQALTDLNHMGERLRDILKEVDSKPPFLVSLLNHIEQFFLPSYI